MFGDRDARRDELEAGEPLEVAEELDPMDWESDTSVDDTVDTVDTVDTDDTDDTVDTDDTDDTDEEWADADDQSDDASNADVVDRDRDDVTAKEDEGDDADGEAATAEVPYAPLDAPLDATPDVPAPPVTGDQAVDEAMLRLAQSQAGSFAERIESGEHAHRSLQSRLGGLGGA